MRCEHCGEELGSGAEVRLWNHERRWHSECWVPWLLDRLEEAAERGSVQSTTVQIGWPVLLLGALSGLLFFGLAFRGAMCLWGGW